jgi:hypothetical protein
LIATSADGRAWKPAKGGVSFQPVPQVQRPLEKPEGRIRQMREIVGSFSAEHFYRSRTWNKLRVLIKPFARYEQPGSDIEDGALFGFAHGTDPEVLLIVEARRGESGVEWQYAIAPMTGYTVIAFWKGKEIWRRSAGADGRARSPSNTIHARRVFLVKRQSRGRRARDCGTAVSPPNSNDSYFSHLFRDYRSWPSGYGQGRC